MDLLTKQDDKLFIVTAPDEKLRVGDVIQSGSIISQVVEIRFADLPGILEHVLRQSLIPRSNTIENASEQIKTMFGTVADSKLVLTKIRGHIKTQNGVEIFKQGLLDFDISREKTKPMVISTEKLMTLLGLNFSSNSIAKTISSEKETQFDFIPNRFGINLITGVKGSGKSYFSKRLLLKLIKAKVLTIVFDVNGEYQDLDKDENGQPNEYAGTILTLERQLQTPQGNKQPFRIPLYEMRSTDFCKAVNINDQQVTFGTILRFWNENHGIQFGLDDLAAFATNLQGQRNDSVKETILDRVNTARAMRLFEGTMDWNQTLTKYKDGGAIIINLSEEPNYLLSIMVKFILKSAERWVKQRQKGISLFLEEAQNYVESDSDFRDILTRMRHIGAYPTFITNDPTTLPEEVMALADNVISFRFESDTVLNHLSKSGKIDNDTLKNLRSMEDGQCICIGKFTNNFPFFLSVGKEQGVKMAGETKPLV